MTGIAIGAQASQTGSGLGSESSPGGGFLFPNRPNIVDFLDFLNNTVQIPTAALPPSSPWPQYALDQALILTLCGPFGIIYTLAVYNCATHLLLTIAPDVAGQNYFTVQRSREGMGLIQPSSGLVAASSDETTSSTLASPDWAKRMTVGQLGFFRTPYGREYLSYIQSYGPNVVGLS